MTLYFSPFSPWRILIRQIQWILFTIQYNNRKSRRVLDEVGCRFVLLFMSGKVLIIYMPLKIYISLEAYLQPKPSYGSS